MKKILVFVDGGLIHFGIAKHLQREDTELFGIIDVDEDIKQIFENQKIVNFKEKWFFRDYVNKIDGNPDIDYLRKFEEKYKINLWNLIYGERQFFKYKINFKNFTCEQLLFILEQECKFFEKVINSCKPDFLAIKLTDLHHLQLLMDLCKAVDVKILMLAPTRFGYQTSIVSDFTEIEISDKVENKKRTVEELQNYFKKYDKIKQMIEVKTGRSENIQIHKVIGLLKKLIFFYDKGYKEFYGNYGRTRIKVILRTISRQTQSWKSNRFIKNNLPIKITFNEKFIYFPLHVEPEVVFSVYAPLYSNQIEIIKNIAKSIPVDYKLYVKDHPVMQVKRAREISFYKEIMKIPNVKLIHMSNSTDLILKNCSLVVSIAGTTGIEASFYNKPTVMFTKTSFTYLSFIHKVKQMDKLSEIIKEALQTKVDFEELNDYVNRVESIAFEHDLSGLANKIIKKFYYGGTIIKKTFTINEIGKFLDENSEEFNKLASEYRKEIEN